MADSVQSYTATNQRDAFLLFFLVSDQKMATPHSPRAPRAGASVCSSLGAGAWPMAGPLRTRGQAPSARTPSCPGWDRGKKRTQLPQLSLNKLNQAQFGYKKTQLHKLNQAQQGGTGVTGGTQFTYVISAQSCSTWLNRAQLH